MIMYFKVPVSVPVPTAFIECRYRTVLVLTLVNFRHLLADFFPAVYLFHVLRPWACSWAL